MNCRQSGDDCTEGDIRRRGGLLQKAADGRDGGESRTRPLKRNQEQGQDSEASLCTIVKVQNVYASSMAELMKDCGVLGYEWTDDATVHSSTGCRPRAGATPSFTRSLPHLYFI